MVDHIAFKTKARTIDHLGREQIADCPTAISELWKNSYDAYARKVEMHLFDEKIPIAAIFDDGHGMSREEFEEKWLVVGTESKTEKKPASEEDRNGLAVRVRQGQKGIGRLSVAALGPLMLLVSKRRSAKFVAALIDWRLFENPFLFLEDIELPVIEFSEKSELFGHLPAMFDSLMVNLWGNGKDSDRDGRIVSAWKIFSELEQKENKEISQKRIENTIIETAFTEAHFQDWGLWQNKCETGTGLLISDIAFELSAHFQKRIQPEEESAANTARDRFFSTLSSFSNPFNEKDTGQNCCFEYAVFLREKDSIREILSSNWEFRLSQLLELEHVLRGEINEAGIFKGRVKVFGEWLEGEITILPEVSLPIRKSSIVGSFSLLFGTYERNPSNSTHPQELFENFGKCAEKYAGIMVYRDGLRVMPYGRADNDFFEVEQRRSKHAGREFWVTRRTFGFVEISRFSNPNLKDKAGREGLIDNKTSKVFKELVINILMQSARRYFGTDSSVRKKILPDLQKENQKAKALVARNEILKRKRREFKTNLTKYLPELEKLLIQVTEFKKQIEDSIPILDEDMLVEHSRNLNSIGMQLRELNIGEVPEDIGSMKDDYRVFQSQTKEIKGSLNTLNKEITLRLESFKISSSKEIIDDEIDKTNRFISKRLKKWTDEAHLKLQNLHLKIDEIASEAKNGFIEQTKPIFEDAEFSRISLPRALKLISEERDRFDKKVQTNFEALNSTLASLCENINIEAMVNYTINESEEIRRELERLNSLAQLGITVEIIGHEIEGFEQKISSNLSKLLDKNASLELKEINSAYGSLRDRLHFLSPLKLSGEKIREWITGRKIYDYAEAFFRNALLQKGISFKASQAFLEFSVYEMFSRIYPVFINLINNSIYWVNHSDCHVKEILLDVRNGKVIVADSGPGIEEEDLKFLFTLFFTRKIRGGRGVGLYLCRSNLVAGNHTINYVSDEKAKVLSGANFEIDFKGANYV